MSTVRRPTGPRRHHGRWLTAYVLLLWLLIAGIVVQVMLAGLAAFDLPEMWRWHARFVNVLEGTALLLLLVALVGRLRDLRWPAAALLLLIGLQHGLATIRGVAGGFHAVVALVLIVLALEAARRTSTGLRGRRTFDGVAARPGLPDAVPSVRPTRGAADDPAP